MAGIARRPGTTYVGLVANRRGGERALAASVDRVNFAFPVTETFSLRNQGRSVADTMRDMAGVAAAAAAAGVPCTVTLGAAFGCPFEGEVEPAVVAELARRAVDSGADEIAIADTIGVGVPRQVGDLVDAVRSATSDVRIGAHFHDTRNTGIANATAAVAVGVTVLDAAVGGAGGCPFAPQATGNVATEDLLYVLQRSGYTPELDIDGTVATALWLERRLGKSLPGSVKRAGVHWETGPRGGVA
jgi:isopropylmalate/homocitrate/citramalate synthase